VSKVEASECIVYGCKYERPQGRTMTRPAILKGGFICYACYPKGSLKVDK